VDLAESILGDLKDRSVLVIGAGETGELISKALKAREISNLYVTNRTFATAQSLAECLANSHPYDQMREQIKQADVVISATSAPHYILLKQDIEEAMTARDKKLLIIDIANPRTWTRQQRDRRR
jgi:glutamyl-tRNA reductase